MRAATDEDRVLLRSVSTALTFWPNEFAVARCQNSIAGYLAWRRLAPGESEILHLLTQELFRRHGIARALLQFLKKQEAGDLLLEVRRSNIPARKLYEIEAFTEVGVRRDYYSDPTEDAIVMKFHSC